MNSKTHMACLLVSLFFLLLPSLVVAQKSVESKHVQKSPYYTGQTGQTKINYASFENWLEQRSGDDLDKTIADRGFIIDDPKLVNPLYGMANKLLEGWPGTAPDISIYVSAGGMASKYGAETLIGNEIIIFYPTLNQVDSDDELAFLLAHELAHVLLRHNKKIKYLNMASQLVANFENIKMINEIIKNTDIVKFKSNGETKYKLDSDEHSIALGLIRSKAHSDQAEEIYKAYHSSVFGRKDESRADLLAADLLVSAGYSLNGGTHSLKRLRSSYEVSSFFAALMAETSTNLLENTKAILLKELKTFDATGEWSNELDSSFKVVKTSLLKQIKSSAKNFATNRLKMAHPVPKSRVAKLNEYAYSHYKMKDRSKNVQSQFLASYRNSASFVSLKKYERVDLAKIDVQNGELSSAASRSISAFNSASDGDPYKRFVTHSIRRSQGNTSSALTNIDRIKNYLLVPNEELADMVDFLIVNDRITKAKNIINQKEKYVGSIANFYPAKIEIALADEDTELAEKIANDCVSVKKTIKGLRDRCRAFGLDTSEGELVGGGLLNSLKEVIPTGI